MENYVTIIDKNYLPQLLVMVKSLLRFSTEIKLWIFCLDNQCFTELASNSILQNTCTLVEIEELMTPNLREAKNNRNIGEFIWTLTPFLPSYIFNKDKTVNRVTYLDADIYFKKSPKLILDSFLESRKHLLLTPHDFSDSENISEIVGKFCVQFLTVTRDANIFLDWWQSRCIEWCKSIPEDGKFGDQKYLDLVPIIFPDLYFSLKLTEYTQGPWNMKKFQPQDAVFFHFHGVRIKKNKIVISGTLPNDSYWKELYVEYVSELFETIRGSNIRVDQFKLFKDYPLFKLNNIYRLAQWIIRKNLIVLSEKKWTKRI
jgi:lipopolysaccharide biosynthesis glycosyltransferase